MSYLTQEKLIAYFSDTLAECCDEQTDPELVIGAFAKAIESWREYHGKNLDYLEDLGDGLGALL